MIFTTSVVLVLGFKTSRFGAVIITIAYSCNHYRTVACHAFFYSFNNDGKLEKYVRFLIVQCKGLWYFLISNRLLVAHSFPVHCKRITSLL
jgi:hypothetical protein